MKFNINDFTVITTKKTEQLQDQIIAPQGTKNGKPINYKVEHKTREFTIFHQLGFKGVLVADDIFDFIALIEAIKGFSYNRFSDEKTYTINNNISAKMVQKDNLRYLKLELSKHTLFLDKLACSILSAQLSKIVQKCEVWQESEV